MSRFHEVIIHNEMEVDVGFMIIEKSTVWSRSIAAIMFRFEHDRSTKPERYIRAAVIF